MAQFPIDTLFFFIALQSGCAPVAVMLPAESINPHLCKKKTSRSLLIKVEWALGFALVKGFIRELARYPDPCDPIYFPMI